MPTFAHAFDWVRRNVDDGPLPTAVLGIATADGVVALDAFGVEGGRRPPSTTTTRCSR